MGCTPDPNGVTISFKTNTGADHPNFATVKGSHNMFFSKTRPVNPGEVNASLGSNDWLTHVIITDDAKKLAAKLAELTPDQMTSAETSCSSKCVTVISWVGDRQQTVQGALTISDCAPKNSAGKFMVNGMSILPGDTDPLQLPDELRAKWLSGVPNLI